MIDLLPWASCSLDYTEVVVNVTRSDASDEKQRTKETSPDLLTVQTGRDQDSVTPKATWRHVSYSQIANKTVLSS